MAGLKGVASLAAGIGLGAVALIGCSTSTRNGAVAQATTASPLIPAASSGQATGPTSTTPDAAPSGAASPKSASGRACGALISANPQATLPTGFPAVLGFQGIGRAAAAKTTAIKGTVAGGPAQVTAVRDAGFRALTTAGYTIGGHDQEAGVEADGDFTGPYSGNINVKALCLDHLVVTYTFTS